MGAKLAKSGVIASIRAFEATLAGSASLTGSRSGDKRREAIEHRRQIAAHRNEIAGLVEAEIECPALRRAFRARFFDLCAAIALHQANWPVVAIDPDDPHYQVSRTSARRLSGLLRLGEVLPAPGLGLRASP